jgi:hypothetical protein
MAPLKVIYLVGTTRCGSTLIGSLLGQVPGVVHVGEIARIWQEGFLDNYRCGCGAPFAECPFWSDVLERAFGGRDAVDPRRMIEIADRWARTRHTPRLATSRGRLRMREGMAEYTDAMTALYRGAAEVAGAHVVLDSSKTPLLAWVMAGADDLDLRILHVTRDPRAVVYSWQRKKFDPAKGADMHRGESPVGSSLAWLAWNGLAAALWDRPAQTSQYLHVRYEDFAEDPRAVLGRLLAWLDEPVDPAAIVDAEHRFESAPAHTIAGNPMRFQRGAVRIAPDTAWQEEASPWDNLLVSGITWPLLGKYRYPIRR